LHVLVLPGDGIGTEVTREAVRVSAARGRQSGITPAQLTEGLLGGVAIHRTGTPFPEETARLAAEADATLMGAVGLPEFDNAPPEKRPEKGLLKIRQALGVYANLRPVRAYKSQLDSSPLKNHLVEGTDMIIVRELTGGIYYGTPRGITGRRRGHAGGQYHDLHARGNRARFPHGLPPGARAAQESHVGG
jgi:3-isopropylmalate dehydrogenase